MPPTPSTRTISLTSQVVAIQEQVSSDLGDELVILDLEAGMYYGLNPVGTRVWELIQEPIIVTNVCDAILSEYDVEAQQCEQDVTALLQDLATKNLIEISNGLGD